MVVEMRPMILYAKFDDNIELTCSIHHRGYEWFAVNIFQQNTSGSVSVLNVSRDGKVESKNARINGSMTVSDYIINVTVSFDVSRGTGVCELNKTYSCNIQLVDPSISSKVANTTLVLESKCTLIISFINIYGTLLIESKNTLRIWLFLLNIKFKNFS